jgi:hypothetical protein
MPLSVNVGLSRKASKDYQSTGVGINLTAELDQALLAKPDQPAKTDWISLFSGSPGPGWADESASGIGKCRLRTISP